MSVNTESLSKIPETMLITLWAKATETGKPSPLLRDEKAVEIIGHINYDFSKFKKVVMSQIGVCIRASLIDNETSGFIAQHPDAIVIQLGAGLDARYERLGCPDITHWYELDLPESIALRRQFFTESPKHTFLELSLFDYQWIEIVKAHQKPVLIIVEGVLMYFSREEVQVFFDKLCTEFKEATVLFDMLAPMLVNKASKHDALRTMDGGAPAEFKWSEKHTRDMEQWNPKIHLDKEYFMSDYDQKRFPLIARLMYKIPYCYKYLNQRIVRIGIH